MRSALLALVVLAACGSHSGDDTATYGSIEVIPAFASVNVALGSTANQDYQVFGVNGSERTDITSRCTLTIDPDFGSFTNATATVGPRGGKANVSAVCTDMTDAAVLAVNIVGSVVTPPAPGNAPDLIGTATAGTDIARTPALEYPLDKAVSPRNMPAIEVQYTAASNDLFHIHITSTFVAIDLYTTSLEATVVQADWEHVIEAAAGDNMTFTVEGLAQASPSTKFASTPVTIDVSRDTIDKSAIYYWASSQGNIMSQSFGTTTAPNIVKNDCTSCHSVNRAGNRIGYSRCVGGACSNLYAGFLKYDMTSGQWIETVNANNMTIHGSYTTFAPEPAIMAIVSMINGTLSVYNPDSGTAIASNLDDVSTHGPGAPRSGLMADWSSDGSKIAFVSAPNPNQWIDLAGGSIATMTYTDNAGTPVFGEPQFLVTSPLTVNGQSFTNLFFPSFSPDNKLLVFNAARAGWRNFTDAKTAGQRLMLADAAGAWTQDLTALNGGATTDSDITWPHWAPTVGSDYYWVVFSSERNYGHLITPTNTAAACVANGVKQCKQIWIAGIARNKLTGTMDPSAPPMWLPGQDISADNISPYWSLPAGLQ